MSLDGKENKGGGPTEVNKVVRKGGKLEGRPTKIGGLDLEQSDLERLAGLIEQARRRPTKLTKLADLDLGPSHLEGLQTKLTELDRVLQKVEGLETKLTKLNRVLQKVEGLETKLTELNRVLEGLETESEKEELSPESRALVDELREAKERPETTPLPKDVRRRVIETVITTPEYREAVRKLGKEMPGIPRAYVCDKLSEILVTRPGFDPPDNIPLWRQRAVVRAVRTVADRAGRHGATARDAAAAEDLGFALLTPERRPRHEKPTGTAAEVWISDVRRHVVPYLKTAAVERPIRADDTPLWDLLVFVATVGLGGRGEAVKTAVAVGAKDSGADVLLDPMGALYEESKEHYAQVAHEKLEKMATAARAYLLGPPPG